MNSHEYQDFYKPFTKVNWSMCELNRQIWQINMLKRHLITNIILRRASCNSIGAKKYLLNKIEHVLLHYKMIKQLVVCYIQRGNNMAKIFNFVNVIILSFFLFFVACDGNKHFLIFF
jgi:hypothetical protein